MVIFLLILIAVGVIFGRDAGQSLLVLSVIGFLLLCVIALIVNFHEQIGEVLQPILSLAFLGFILFAIFGNNTKKKKDEVPTDKKSE